MRIILFIVFYVATYVARIAIGGDIAKTVPESSMRYIFKQKSGATRSRVSEISIDDGIIQMINKRNRQSLLGNRIDGFPLSRNLNNNLKRVKRSLRKRKKYAKNSDGKIAHRQNDYVNDDDTNRESISSNVARFPIWRVPESTAAAINLDSTTNPTIMETEMTNRSLLAFERPPSQLEDLDYDRSLNEAIFPIAERYPNSRGLSDINVSNQDLILSKIADSKPEIEKVDVQSPAFGGLNDKMLFPAYRSGIPAGVNSSNFSRSREFQQRHNRHRKDPSNPYNVKEELLDDRLTGSNKKFLLVPVSKDLYVLKDVRESPRTGVDGIIIPKRYKLLERDKDNATSAILSFKAHMHHDAKDVGRAYLRRGNHRLFDHNANYLYPIFDPRIPEESANPTENPVPPSYPDFLYPGIVFQTRPNLIDTTPEISDEQIASPVPDYENISLADINSRGGINSYDSSAFLSSSSLDIPNYDVFSKENTNDGQPSVSSAIKLNDEISLFQQDSGNYGNSLGYSELGVELTTTDFRDTFGTLDDIYTPATLENVEMYLTSDKEVFDISRNREDDSKFSTGWNEDKPTTDFIDDISTQYKAAFDASANEADTFFPNITYTSVSNAEDVLNSEDIDKENQKYGISILGEYNDKKLTYFNDLDYNNRSIDEALLSNCTTEVDSFLNTEDYVTSTSLLSDTDKWPLKKAQSNVENSRVFLMAIKPLSSELEKLLSAVKLVNQSISNVQSRLCDKKNVVRSARTERENKDRKATNIAKLANKIDHYDSDLSIESFNSQSLDKRRIKTKDGSVAERDVKIRRKTNGLFLNKLTTPFHKRESSISNSEVQSGHRNFFKKRKLNEREFPKSGDVEGRRLPYSRFNRNLKSLTKNYEMRVKPIRPFIETGLKRMKRTTTPITRLSRFIKSNVLSKNNFADGRAQNRQGSNRSMILLNNMPSMFLNISTKKDNSAHFLSNDKRDLTQRNVKRAMSSEISGSDKEKKFPSTDPQFQREATAYLDILRLLGKTEKPYIKYATEIAWTTQNLTESFPPMIFTTTEFSISTVTFLPYFTEEPTITASSTIAEKEEASEMSESSLYEYVTVTDFGYSKEYGEQNYTKMNKGYEYEEITSEISEIISLTQSPVTLNAFTITMPTMLPLFYTTELTILPIDEAAILTTEIITEKIAVTSAIVTEVTETPITIPTIENFTTESAMLLTPFLEGMTDITLKITIPAATKSSIGETSALIAEVVTTEEEIMEGTSTTPTTEVTQSSLLETNISLYTFSTVSLLRTTETELTIKTTSPTVPVSTSLTITKGLQTSESIVTERTIAIPTVSLIIITTLDENVTLYKAESTTAIASSPTVLEKTETILSTSTEVAITTLIPEDESPVTQIEKTITAEETATEIPTTIETARPTEITISTTETSTTATEISTYSTIETTITKILIMNKTLTTAKTSIKTPTATEIPMTSTIPTTIEATTITKTSTPTKILTTLKTPITKEITGAKTLTPTETLTPIETKPTTEIVTTEISTSTEATTITKIQTTETLTTTETLAFTETSTTSEIPTTTIPTTREITASTETSTPTEILTILKTPITKGTTSVKTLTPTETLTPIEIKTTTETVTTEISTSTEATTITKIKTTETLTTTETSAFTETSTISETPTISTISTIETTATTETSTPTEILTTLKTPIIKGITAVKTLKPIETVTPIETKTTTETSTTITETLSSTEIPTISTISTTSTIPTTTETTATTETSTLIEILTTTKIPTTKKTTSTKVLTSTIMETPSTTETQIITEIPTTTETSGTTEIPVISTTHITTKFFTTSESTTSSMATTSLEEFFSTSILTTFTTVFTTETAESTLTSLITSVTTTVPYTLKLPTTTPLTLITNTTLSETPYTTISSTFLTTTEGPVTTMSLKTTVPTTSLKVTTTTPLSLVTSTMLSETPNTTFSTFLIEETTASPISTTTASSLETFQTTAVLLIPTTVSTIETFLTTSSIATYMTENVTVPSTTASTITTEIPESTISPVIYFTVTTPPITKIPITTPIVMDTGTTVFETTSTLITSSFLTEIIESTTSPIIEHEETKEYEEYESTKEEIATVATKLTTKKRTTWITAEEITIRETTSMTYLPSFTTPFFIETTTEATPLVIETITLPTITEETSLIEKIVTVTPITMIEETSTLSEVTLISTEISTVSAIETSITSTTLIPTITATTASFLEETATEITETSLITMTAALLPITERPKYATILEAAVTVTLAPFSESILSILITSETPATTVEVISILPKTVSEEFTVSTTESPSITYATKSSATLFTETTVPAVSISAATTEETLEAETEYYVAKEPIYEEEYEEYEEYDTEIPTGKWYYYDEYETTTKKRTTATVKYTKLPKEETTSPPFVKGTTTSYEIETSEFTRYSTPSETSTSTYTSETSTKEEVASTFTLETIASAIIENVTTIEVETEFTASSASEEIESTTTWLTFGSTEEYTLPSSTVFEIPTEPLEYLTIPPKYTDLERFTQIWHKVTSPKFITKPKEIPEIVLKKTTTSERVSTETEVAVEKLTSFFISSALTTLSEKEAIEVRTTTISTASSEIEGTIETGYEITTLAMTEEEIVPRVTPFITSEAEIELVFTTTSKTTEREEQKEQLLQRLDDFKHHEREMAEREERLKEKEKQWDIEKEKRRKMMQREKEEAKNITIVTGTTEGYVTTTITVSITSPVATISTKNLTESTTTETEVTSPGLHTSITTLSLAEITTIPTKITPFSITEEITSVTYITEKTKEATTEGSTSTMYATEETEETLIPYTTEKSISITYLTEEIEKVQITDYVILTPYVTTSMDLYVGLASIETTTPFTVKEIYTTSYISETTPFSITEESTSMTYTTEKTEEATTEGRISTTYATEETEETVIPYTTEKSTSIAYLTEQTEEVQITDYVTWTPYVTTSIVDLYSVGLASIETTTPYTIKEIYTTSYAPPLYSEPLFIPPTITSPITSVTGKFTILPTAIFSERFEEISVTSATTPTWYTTEETYTAIYSKPLFTSPAEFTSTIYTSSTLAISTTVEVKYDEEIESLREELLKKGRELEEREKILLERKEKLEKDIMEFEKYMEEFRKKKTSITPSEKSTVLTSLSTPVPPTEKTTKAQLTTQIKKVTEKKENRTTTKMVTFRHTEMKEIEEKKRTKHVSEETVTQEEEEIVTKRICLNVLENTTTPLDKRRRNIVTKKICLPYFPEKNRETRSVGRLSRRLLALQSKGKIRKPRLNIPSHFRYRKRVIETTHKIDNLQLSHHEWLTNETTKPLRHFKGFTRIYRKMRKFPKKISTIIDTRRNTTSDFQDRTPLYEQHVLDHESVFQPTATSMLDSKAYRKRNAFFRYDLISAKKSNFPIDDKASVRKRNVLPIENNIRFWSTKSIANISSQRATTATEAEEDGFYTVNVLHFSYNEDKQMHEVISAKPNEDELTAILSESNDDIYVTEFGEGRKITTPYYESEEKDDLEEEDELSDEMEKKMEEEDDYVEDMIENYMNYEEHETSIRIHDGRFLDHDGKDKRTTENERELLDQSWPTEKSTTYHLGGTRFWELDFVTEPSVILRTTVDKSKPINVPITRTTCFDVVLKNERSTEIKLNVPYHKRNVYNNGTRKHVSIKKRNAGLKNVTRKNALRYKLRTKRPRVVAKKLKRDSRKLHEPNYYKQSFEEKRTVKFNDFWRASNEDSITAKSRKLCGVNANKSKRQVVKHKDATEKHKKKQLEKWRALQNINLHSPHNTDNCAVNKKNKYHQTMTTASRYSQVETIDDKKDDEKVTHPNIIDHKSKATSTSHKKKIHNCFNCICDIANVVNKIKSLLDKISFPLDEIKALNCSEYKEIQNKIVISMDSDVEEAREFPQPHYNTESLKGQKYIKLEELEDNFKSDLELDSDHDIISLPGLNLNLPCNQNGDGITWLSSVSRPSYAWKRTDGIALFGFVAENGDLELRNVNAKDTGNYTCVITYMSPDNEEPVETAYEVNLQVVTLPRYIVHGESRYHVRSCDERDLDVLVTYLPLKLNSVICEADVCNAYILTPSCSRSQITVNILLVPSHIVKLMTVDPKHCNVFCLKAIQDKLSLILSKNLQIFLGKTIIFRLPHYEQRLVPIDEKSSFARRKRGKSDANVSAGRFSNIGLFSSCPAGYGLRDTRCVPCNVGTYSEDGISHCKRCPSGTYQPNHGARVCRTCTNPLTKGCYNMLWNSFSAIMITFASIGAMLSICLLLLWIICCAQKKFCVKRIASIVAKEDAFEREKHVEEQPLIKDASENEDQQWDSEYRVKKKKGKFYINKKRRKQNERRKYDKMHVHEDEWGSHRVKNAPITCPDSYQSHEDYNNYYPKQSYHKGPRLPECDFDT